MSERFQILSLDGGGLKGIFTASFLSAIEETTRKNIVDYFDLIAGTSTGGIIALALGLGFRPEEILSFYKERGNDIFPAQSFCGRVPLNIKTWFRRKYSSKPLQCALRDYFGNRRLCESTKRLIIPSYDSVRGAVYIYKTPHHEKLRTDYKELVQDVALATTSAPTYFQSFITDAGVRLIDGGIWANNPSMVALAEALGYLARPQGTIAILSIGTTRQTLTSMKSHIAGGIWAWRRKALEFMMSGQSRAAENQCFHILSDDRFLRINPTVGGDYALDKMSEELEGIGKTEARNRVDEVNNIFLQHKAKPYLPIYKLDGSSSDRVQLEENSNNDK